MTGGEVFSEDPVVSAVDLAEAVAPGLQRDIIGVRPGERHHEVVLIAHESRHAVDAGSVYVVLPEQPWSEPHTKWLESKSVDHGSVYSSCTNDWWLNGDELASSLP